MHIKRHIKHLLGAWIYSCIALLSDQPWMLPQKPNPTKQPIAHKDATWVMWAEQVIATLGHTTLPFSQTHKFHWFALICDLRELSHQFQGSIHKIFSYTGFTLPVKMTGIVWKREEQQTFSTTCHSFLSTVWFPLLTTWFWVEKTSEFNIFFLVCCCC